MMNSSVIISMSMEVSMCYLPGSQIAITKDKYEQWNIVF
ncbi:hypothetical protein SAMN05216419_100941 [Nitrosomonas cryotolerans]|nr:hypothetical protein SAMN05216419_100941 [Nitrosomonas cryotolerans]